MPNSPNSRRSFIKKTSVGIVGAAALSVPRFGKAATNFPGETMVDSSLQLGVASYSLREFPLEQALDMTLRCGVNRITLKSMHLPLDSDAATILKTSTLCKQKGIALYGAGVIYMKNKEEVDQAFQYAKTAGMKMIIGVPNHGLLDYVEGKVKETDVKLAIHNHGPGDKLYSSPEDAYVRIKDRDARMGLCIDIGHCQRIGRDPAADVTQFADRLFDVHLKDVTLAKAEGKSCIIGRGVIDFQTFLKTMDQLDYQGTLALEYEAEATDPLPGMMESIGYVKGIMSTL